MKLPAYAISIIATLLVVVMGFTIRASARAQEMKSDIIDNVEDIEKLDEDKASKESVKSLHEEVDRTYDAIIRLEGKFDTYVKETN